MVERWKFVKRIVPEPFALFFRDYRNLHPQYRLTYLKVRRVGLLGLRSHSHPFTPAGVRSILFVCKGNVIRSPMAAALLKKHLQDAGRETLHISSAGLHATAMSGADHRAVIISREYGVCLDEHRARPLTPEQVAEADAIFVMDYRNEAELLGRSPGAKRKFYRLCEFAEGLIPNLAEIQYPFGGNASDIH